MFPFTSRRPDGASCRIFVRWVRERFNGRNIAGPIELPLLESKPHMATDHFLQLAAYNRWANARLYAAALDLRIRHIGFTSVSSSVACTAH
jgi:hypothetical protein